MACAALTASKGSGVNLNYGIKRCIAPTFLPPTWTEVLQTQTADQQSHRFVKQPSLVSQLSMPTQTSLSDGGSDKVKSCTSWMHGILPRLISNHLRELVKCTTPQHAH